MTPKSPSSLGMAKGFSLVELLVVITIISTLTALSLSATLHARKREQINALTIQLAGWIEEVRRSSMRGSPCDIRITNGSVSGSAVIAQANPTLPIRGTCSTIITPAFRIPDQAQGQTYQVTATTTDFTFTPRGTKTPASDITITIRFTNSNQARCIRLTGLLGNLEMGNAPGGVCDTTKKF